MKLQEPIDYNGGGEGRRVESVRLQGALSLPYGKNSMQFSPRREREVVHSVDRLLLLGVLGLLVALLASLHDVRRHEELREEDEQRQDVEVVEVYHVEREGLAAVVDQIEGLCVHQHELNHLRHRQRGLPRNVLGVERDKVVSIHNSMDQSIEYDSEIDIAIISNVDVEPVNQEDGEVVVDVEEGQLAPALLENNKNCVKEVQDLGKIEDIENKAQGGLGVVERLARSDGVALLVGAHTSLNAHVRAQHHLHHVVHKLERVQSADGRHVGHDQL